jgi:hypothetical protein
MCLRFRPLCFCELDCVASTVLDDNSIFIFKDMFYVSYRRNVTEIGGHMVHFSMKIITKKKKDVMQ